MAPTRKSRFSSVNEVSPSKDAADSKKSIHRKRKLADMLGSQWRKEELECFYEAYRKYGKDWNKVAAAVRNRSVEMVEALYKMNRAYLSLPDGTASVVGLIAMMTDHYCNMGESDSEQESNDGGATSRKSQKRGRGSVWTKIPKRSEKKLLSHSETAASNFDCLSLLKKPSGGTRPRAVGKRTPRVQVTVSCEKAGGKQYFAPTRRGLKPKADTDNESVEHEVALALAEASQKGGSPPVSQISNRRTGSFKSSSIWSGEKMGTEFEPKWVKHINYMDEDSLEGSSGSRVGDKGVARGSSPIRMESTANALLKGRKKYVNELGTDYSVNNQLDDIKEARMGTVEQNFGVKTGKMSRHISKKKSKKALFGRDETSDFDALQTLAELSLMMPATETDDESSVHLKEKEDDLGSKYGSLEIDLTAQDSPKSFGVKTKGNQAGHKGSVAEKPEHGKYLDSENNGIADVKEQPQQSTSRLTRKKQQMFISKIRRPEVKTVTHVRESQGAEDILPNCLSNKQVRRWCAFEWFYSAIDYPWFAKRDFVEYLKHVGLGHVPRLTRVEWGVIRSSLGKPRRFSEQFLKEEKEKLNQYRDSVRKHYTDLLEGSREGLPTDLPRPLTVGQRVMAIHPKTREIHDGNVLTVDHNRYRVQFDLPELGVEFVPDIDCMPLNPSDNMPLSLARNAATMDKLFASFNEFRMSVRAKDQNLGGVTKTSSGEMFKHVDVFSQLSPSRHLSHLVKQAKEITTDSSLQAKVGIDDTDVGQRVVKSGIVAQVQAKEADVQAIAELKRALEKKEAVVSELRHMNDDVIENERDGNNALKDSVSFKKHCAALVVQLKEINDQVSRAIQDLRQRNTYHSSELSKATAIVGDSDGSLDTTNQQANHVQELGSHLHEIVESSRRKARTLVDSAMQAISSLKIEEKPLERIEEAVDYVSNRLSLGDSSVGGTRSFSPAPIHGNLSLPTISKLESKKALHRNEAQIPSELISHCVATLFMIQKCTERQFPPEEVAQILDSAVVSLQPCSPQNIGMYGEIQKCMGIIRNQILALVP